MHKLRHAGRHAESRRPKTCIAARPAAHHTPSIPAPRAAAACPARALLSADGLELVGDVAADGRVGDDALGLEPPAGLLERPRLDPARASAPAPPLPPLRRPGAHSRGVGLVRVRDAGRKQAAEEAPVHDVLPRLLLGRRLRRVLVQEPARRLVVRALVPVRRRHVAPAGERREARGLAGGGDGEMHCAVVVVVRVVAVVVVAVVVFDERGGVVVPMTEVACRWVVGASCRCRCWLHSRAPSLFTCNITRYVCHSVCHDKHKT